MIMCMFQYYSLHSSHLLLPPLCPQVCSLCLCLCCCLQRCRGDWRAPVHGVTKSCTWLSVLAQRFISTSFLEAINSAVQSCLTLCDPMNHSTPGLHFHHQIPESTQTHVHRVSDAIQPSYPLSSPSPPAPNLSQYQGLFQ